MLYIYCFIIIVKGNTYLQFVESYRNHKGRPATRVLANLRNITKMSVEEVDRLITSFIKATGMQEKYRKLYFETGKGYHYGTVLPVMAIWHQLELEQIIDNAVSSQVVLAGCFGSTKSYNVECSKSVYFWSYSLNIFIPFFPVFIPLLSYYNNYKYTKRPGKKQEFK